MSITDQTITEKSEEPSRLWNKNFFLQWQGQTISRLGTQAFLIGQLFWIKQYTESATLLGLLAMVSNIPGLFMGPIGGVIADRYSRRMIIIICDFLRGISLLLLTGIMILRPDETELILIVLFGVSVFNALINPVFSSAIQSTIPDLVPRNKVTAANSIGQLSIQLTMFFGQMVGGTLYRILGPTILFFLDGLSFFYSSGSEVFVKIPQKYTKKNSGWKEQFSTFGQDIKEGMKYVWEKPGLRETVFASAFIAFFSTPVIILLPFYVEDHLSATVDWYGYILAFSGIGAIIGYTLAGGIRLRPQIKSRVLITFMILNALGYAMLGLVSRPAIAVFLAFLAGIATGFVTVHFTSIIQLTTPTEIRGRVLGLLAAISGSLTPLAMGLAGVVADLVNQNIPVIYFSCGIIMILMIVLVSFSKPFRQFLATPLTLEKAE
jgi:MFS family permease